MKVKTIDISKIDINELIYDSDDSTEDQDSNIGKDDFETNLINIINEKIFYIIFI